MQAGLALACELLVPLLMMTKQVWHAAAASAAGVGAAAAGAPAHDDQADLAPPLNRIDGHCTAPRYAAGATLAGHQKTSPSCRLLRLPPLPPRRALLPRLV